MKLSWKIVLVVLLIVTATVSVSSYSMILSGFQAELDSQIDAAVDESQMLCLTIGVLASKSQGREESILLNMTQNSGFFQNYALTLYREDSTILWSNQDRAPELSPGDLGDQGLCYSFFQSEESGEQIRYLETLQKLSLEREIFYVDLLRDASQVFRQRDANLTTYRRVVLISVAVSTMAAIFCATVLTGPIRKLSRSTRSMAGGQYSRRVKVHSRDELGQLAEDFNHMADTLEAKIRELAEAAQRQRDFTASFAHELKTPLTSVIGYADTLRSRNLPREQQLQAASYIFSEGKRLEAMSFSLLDLFALERSEPQMSVVQAQALARSVEESIGYVMAQGQITLHISVEAGSFRGEGNLLKTMLYNLLDNARKASAAGGTVELLGRTGPEGYTFVITDHGRGIPQEALNRIMEPFYMVDKSRARAQGGAGLGLALCQRIAEAHHAALHFESQEQVGTQVSITLGGGNT